MMMATWAAFAGTGNPNNSTLLDWPQYDTPSRQTIVLDISPPVVSNPGGRALTALEALPHFNYRNSIPAIVSG